MFKCEKCGKEAASKAGLLAHQRKCVTKVEEVEVAPDAPKILLELKGFIAYEQNGFHVKNTKGQIVGHFPTADKATRFVVETSRFVR